jgi:hypothetical protein
MQIVGSTLRLLSTTERASTSRRFGHGGGATVSAKRPVVLLVDDDPLMLDLLEVEFTEPVLISLSLARASMRSPRS